MNAGLANMSVHSVHVAEDGDLLAGTEGGVFDRETIPRRRYGTDRPQIGRSPTVFNTLGQRIQNWSTWGHRNGIS